MKRKKSLIGYAYVGWILVKNKGNGEIYHDPLFHKKPRGSVEKVRITIEEP